MGLSFPALNLADLPAADLAAFADWLTEATAATAAEQARRREATERAARAAAYRIATEFPDDPRWTPQEWDGARIAAGPGSGRTGFIVGRCGDGCERVDGQPHWRLLVAGGGPVWTCLPREHLRPVPTVRRDNDPTGRRRCDYRCLCCKSAPGPALVLS